MIVSIVELLQALDEEIPGLEALIANLRQQRERLVSRDVPLIIEGIKAQEQLVEKIQLHEKRRRLAMLVVAKSFSLDEDANLEKLCDYLPAKSAVQVRERRKLVRQLAEKVQRLNTDNQRLMRQALDAVEKLAAAVSGMPPAQPVYEQNGLIRAPTQMRALIDQVT